MFVRKNPIFHLIFFYNLSKEQVCLDLDISDDYLDYLMCDYIFIPRYVVEYFLNKTNSTIIIFER